MTLLSLWFRFTARMGGPARGYRRPMRFRLWHVPLRAAAGAFILHSGLQKRGASGETAEGLHGFAATAYPQVADIPPARFVAGLSAGEIALGTALLAPVVPPGLAGAALTGFSASLLGLYVRTPGMREDGSLAPTQQGIALAKDVWLLAIGLALVAGAASPEFGRRRKR